MSVLRIPAEVYSRCPVCNKKIACYPSTIGKKKFCSKECKETTTKIKYICLECGKEFLGNKCYKNAKSIHRKTCSEKCYKAYTEKSKQSRDKKNTHICKNCGKEFISPRNSKLMTFCSQKCSRSYMKGKNSPFYRTGLHKGTLGYYTVVKNGKRIYVHRIEAERKIGRKLKKGEVVHHVDGNKLNNSFENLMVMDKIEHDRYHTIRRHESVKKF